MKMVSQQGSGLLEILVALVILAIGALGYIMLQVRALEATMESTQRIQAINTGRDLAERVRSNRAGWINYQTELMVASSGIAENVAKATETPDCATAACTAAQMADFDVAEIASYASQYGMNLGMQNCPSTSNRRCLYVAWGDTKAFDHTTNTASCTNGPSYRTNSTCIMMEVY